MFYINFGRLGSFTKTYHEVDKGSGLDAWRDGDLRNLRWGAHLIFVEFGRGKNGHGRPVQIGWGCRNKQITLHTPKAREAAEVA